MSIDNLAPSMAVVLVDPDSSGLHLVAAIRRLGFRPVALCSMSPELWEHHQVTGELACPPWDCFRELFSEVVFCEIPAEMAVGLRGLPWPVAAVVAGSKVGIEHADRVASELGLPCNDPSSTPARCNKVEMTRAAREHGLATGDVRLCRDESDLEAFMSANGLPIVLRTLCGMATSDAFFCRNPDEGRGVFRRIRDSSGPMGRRPDGVLAESSPAGDCYAVNLFVHEGKTVVTDIWCHRKAEGPRGGNVCLGDDLVPEAVENQPLLVEYATRLAEAVGVRIGPAHAEIKVGPIGPVMVEIGSGLAGSRARMASAYSDFDTLEATVRAFVGWRVEMPDKVRFRKRCRIVNCVARRGGVVRRIHGLGKILELPSYAHHGIYVREGERVEPTIDLVGIPMIVELAHKQEEQLCRDVDLVHDHFDLLVDEV